MRSSPPGPLFSCDVLFLASVHYRAWVNGSGEPIHDTWQEQQRKEMVIGHGTYPNPKTPTTLNLTTSGPEIPYPPLQSRHPNYLKFFTLNPKP